MQALTLEALTASLGRWVGQGELKAVLERRDRMKAEFDERLCGQARLRDEVRAAGLLDADCT